MTLQAYLVQLLRPYRHEPHFKEAVEAALETIERMKRREEAEEFGVYIVQTKDGEESCFT